MANMQELTLSQDGLTVFLPNGGTATFSSVEARNQAMQMLGAGGGGGASGWRVAVDAGEAVFAGITAARLKEAVDEARDDERDLQDIQERLVQVAKASTGLPAEFATLLQDCFVRQRRVDRSQNRALSTAVTAEVIHAVGGAARVVTSLAPSRQLAAPAGGGLGGAGAFLLGGVGAVALTEWFGDDDRSRRRSRVRYE